MALNNVEWKGSDSRYIQELERIIKDLQREVTILQTQTNSRSR
jgi:hypothetical protein